MVLVIPALQLIDGQCSLYVKGESGTESLYSRLSNRPVELCSLWRKENAKTIHITDYDSNYSKTNSNLDAIIFLAQLFDIPFQVLANFKSKKECEYLLDNGIYRICFGEFAFLYPDETRELLKKYSTSKVTAFIDSENDKIQFSQFSDVMNTNDLIEYYKELGFQRIIYKESDWVYGKKHIDYDKLVEIAVKNKMRITLFDAVDTPQKMWELNGYSKMGIDSLVIGQALYSNNFPCQKIWRKIEAELDK